MTETPAKYQAATRDWERKSWLYEQYWGEFKSTRDIATEVSVGYRAIGKKLRELGIPRRPVGWQQDSATSPFTGFYGGDENAQTSGTEVNTAAYDSEKAQDGPATWGELKSRVQ